MQDSGNLRDGPAPPIRYSMGSHLVLDLRFTPGYLEQFTIQDWIARLTGLAEDLGLVVLQQASHDFGQPGALTALLLLSTSHISVHTWPEWQSAAVDLYHCGPIIVDVVQFATSLGALDWEWRLLDREVPWS